MSSYNFRRFGLLREVLRFMDMTPHTTENGGEGDVRRERWERPGLEVVIRMRTVMPSTSDEGDGDEQPEEGLLCNDCGRPCAWDEQFEDYVHLPPHEQDECFLIKPLAVLIARDRGKAFVEAVRGGEHDASREAQKD